jgi:L-iditol 2-dehydrogenase
MINTSLIYNNKSLKLVYSKVQPKKDDVVIKVKSCGICGSDMKILRGKNKRVKVGRVIGHEIAGQICHIVSKKIINTNQNIVLGADIPNQKKKDFALGHEIDGGFQKYLIINKKLLKKVPHVKTYKKINFNLASLCEPLACTLNGFEKINFKKSGDILIFGNGPMGNLIASVGLFFNSKRILIIDNNNKRMKLGIKSRYIKRLHIDKLKNQKNLINFKYGFIACNSAFAQNNILKYISHNGYVNYFSGVTYDKKFPLIDTNLIHYKELKIVGSHGSKKKHILKAANLIVNKKIKLNNIISNCFKLKSFLKAFDYAKKQKGLKIILNP